MNCSRLVFISLAVLIIASCSVQKRKYLPGFYLSWKHKNVVEHHEKENRNTNTKAQIAEVGVSELTAKVVTADAGENETAFLKKEPVLLRSNPNDSCDIVIYRDGTEIRARVVEISTTTVKYKACGSTQQQVISVRKSELLMIKYGNGMKEVFKQETNPTPSRSQPAQAPPVKRSGAGATTLLPGAIFGFILGLVSFVALFVDASGLTPGTIALILLGSMICSVAARSVCRSALRKIKSSGGEYSGKGYAIAGLVLAWITLLIFILSALYGLTR